MHSKTNRVNHDFQIAYFLVGSCYTPDAAYSLLCDLQSDRRDALNMYSAGKLKEEAAIIRATKKLKWWKLEETKLEGRAELAEISAISITHKACYDAAVDELKFIEKCISKIEPHRKYSHLPVREAHEACQQEEWKYELIARSDNHMVANGTILPPAEHFATMRMHPEFESAIIPAIEKTAELLRLGKKDEVVKRLTTKQFELPMLEVKYGDKRR